MKLKKILQLWAATVFAALTLFMPLSASALTAPLTADLKGDAKSGLGQACNNCSGQDFQSIFKTVANILAIVAGGVGVIMIIVAGFKFMTAGSDTNKVASAKTTLIWAMVGIAIAAMAPLLVHFALNQGNSPGSGL